MKRTRLIALTISACMILGATAACSKDDDKDETTAAETEATDPVDESETETETETESEPAESETEVTAFPTETDETEPEPYYEYLEMTPELQEQANLFMTVFANSGLDYYDRENKDVEELLNFAHLYLKFFSGEEWSYVQKGDLSFEAYSINSVRGVTGQWLGQMILDSDLEGLSAAPEAWDGTYGPYYENENVLFHAADGEAHTRIAIVDYVQNDGGSGFLVVGFTIYEVDWEVYAGLQTMDDFLAYCELTPADAAVDHFLTEVETGTAIVGVNQNGSFYMSQYNVAD